MANKYIAHMNVPELKSYILENNGSFEEDDKKKDLLKIARALKIISEPAKEEKPEVVAEPKKAEKVPSKHRLEECNADGVPFSKIAPTWLERETNEGDTKEVEFFQTQAEVDQAWIDGWHD